MIVKNSGFGKSFKGLSTYLTHDPKSDTKERVAWTHTHNLADDDIGSAVNLMYLTAENAEYLKREAGVRNGGRATENCLKHYSLNWAPGQTPTKEHMIEAGEGFLRHMGWHEHQAIFVAHNDKSYSHLHIMLNTVHPETGLRLNDSYEHRRAQEWALAYELENGRIFCEQRLVDENDREKNMPRNMAISFKANEQEFRKAEHELRDKSEPEEYSAQNRKSAEWKILKEIQRDEREQFFADGKQEFKELRATIYREIREEFRQRWADYYQADKKTIGEDRRFLAGVKAQIMADQKAALEPRRDAACSELLEERKLKYRDLLDNQKEERAEFTWRLDAGLDNSDFFHDLTGKRERRNAATLGFREAANEVTHNSAPEHAGSSEWAEVEHRSRSFSSRRGLLQALEFGPRKVADAVGAFVDSGFTWLTNLGSAKPEPVSAEERADQFREAAENALKQHQHQAREEEDAEWRERQKSYARE